MIGITSDTVGMGLLSLALLGGSLAVIAGTFFALLGILKFALRFLFS